MKIAAFGGSIRSNPNNANALEHLVGDSHDLASFTQAATEHYAAAGETRQALTNTEIAAGAALVGAKLEGAEVSFFPLARLFRRRENSILDLNAADIGLHDDIFSIDFLNVVPEAKDKLTRLVNDCGGLLLSTPTYFGDRSSVSNKFLQIAGHEHLLKNKVVGSLSAGAKRNGGQETANLLQLNEARNLGAYIVGNGPKSCQYGGTVVAGDIGSCVQDRWGLETCFGAGRRVAQVARILESPADERGGRNHIVILVMMDTPQRTLASAVEHLAAENAKTSGTKFTVVELLKGDVERCLACSICPTTEVLDDSNRYACIIKTKRDTMASIRETLISAHGLVMAGLNLKDMSNVQHRYQAFTERTRFIRRNDLELTNVPVTSFHIDDAGALSNELFHLKVMTSYMRHNTIVCHPIIANRHDGQWLDIGQVEFNRFVDAVAEISQRRGNAPAVTISYIATGDGGYADGTLDHTEAQRQ